MYNKRNDQLSQQVHFGLFQVKIESKKVFASLNMNKSKNGGLGITDKLLRGSTQCIVRCMI